MKTVLIICAVALMAVNSYADAVFSEVRVLDGVRLYPDSENRGLYYFSPAGIVIDTVDGVPAFSFQRFRYIGRRTTGDLGEFWVKGIISFTVRFVSAPENLDRAKASLEKSLRRKIQLLPLPIVGIRSSLIYELVSGGRKNETGTIEGGGWSEDSAGVGELWSEHTYTVSTDPLSTNLLWDSYHENAIVMALSVSAVASGISERTLDKVVEAQKTTRAVLATAIRIDVSPQLFPRNFSSIDIEEKMPAGYTFLDVYCYDFQEDSDPDLESVLVEVRGQAITGDESIQIAKFSRQQPDTYKREIHFQFAMNLDRGYSYRVTRINARGEITPGEWQIVDHWNGVCDVSRIVRTTRGPESLKKLDPRDLY